jgi:ribonuclease HII
MMIDLDRFFPQWGFARHKGYGGGGDGHEAALAMYGPSPIHRHSSAGVRRPSRPGLRP